MSSSNDSTPDPEGPDDSRHEHDQDATGGSGEGAASALAHLKKQVRKHRRETGEMDDTSEGPAA